MCLLTVYDWALAVLKTQYGLGSWLCGHIVSILPLLFSFFVITHFAVRTIEMEFQSVHLVRLDFLVYRSFVQRFFQTYLLGAFCAFALVWNDYTIKQRQLVITGSSSYLGQALVVQALNRGHRVIAVTHRPAEMTAGVGADRLIHLGSMDLTSADALDRLAVTVQDAFQGAFGVVNCTGYFPGYLKSGDLLIVPDD